jgi:hypothetical protein
MASDFSDLRPEAETRVQRRFERQTTALNEWQREERERDTRAQARAVEDSTTRQATLEQGRDTALADHDKAWEQLKARLTPRPSPAPTFDLIGTPPNRSLVQHHDEMRRRWTERREQIVKDFDNDIGACETARAEMLEGFGQANRARDQAHAADRLQLVERQQQSFEQLVQRELARADRWTSREFQQRSRDNADLER